MACIPIVTATALAVTALFPFSAQANSFTTVDFPVHDDAHNQLLPSQAMILPGKSAIADSTNLCQHPHPNFKSSVTRAASPITPGHPKL